MEKARSMRLHKKVIGSGLVERAPEPALISIGLPLPGLTLDIPGLIEVNGGAIKTTTSSAQATTTATPTPTHSTSTAKAATTAGSGGNSGGNGATTQTGSSSTPTGSSSGNSGSSGNGSGGGSGSGSGNGGGSSDNNGSGDDTSASGSLSSSAPGSTPSASSGIITGSGNSTDKAGGSSNPNSDSSDGSVSSGVILSSNAPSPVVNIAGDPSATGTHTTDANGNTIFVSGSITVTSAHGASTVTSGSGSRGTGSTGTPTNGNNNGNSGGGGGDTPTSNGSSAASSGKVSAGVIAAICVVVGLALLILFLLGLRRWHKKRRTQRLMEWADRSKKGGLFMFGAFSEKPATAGSAATIADPLRSARSSFGTTIEHTRPFSPLPAFDQTLSENTAFFTPLQSPSATAMHSATSIVPDMPPVSVPQSAMVRPPSRNSSVFSIGSDSSHGSQRESGGAQYLSLPPMNPDNKPQLSPISVRPFSPSESWAFPKPPTNPPTPSISSRPLSGDSKFSVATEMPVPPIPVARASEHIPQEDAAAQDPFADSQSIPVKSDPFADPERTPTMPAPVKGLDIPVKRPASSGTMHTMSTAAGSEVSLGILDVIRRPFVPTLADELAVTRGDQIRILQCFDDGWAQIEKMETGEAGLIPVDCLREAGEDLPEFLAARRVSSYYGGVAV